MLSSFFLHPLYLLLKNSGRSNNLILKVSVDLTVMGVMEKSVVTPDHVRFIPFFKSISSCELIGNGSQATIEEVFYKDLLLTIHLLSCTRLKVILNPLVKSRYENFIQCHSPSNNEKLLRN